MSDKTINDLRAALFDALQKVKDGTMDLDKARAVNELGKTLIDSAKVEVDYLRTTGGGRAASSIRPWAPAICRMASQAARFTG